MLPRGAGSLGDPERAEVLASILGSTGRTVVVDCGVVTPERPASFALAATATHSLLVTRPCYLALRRAQRPPVRPSGVVCVTEPGRALTRHDLQHVIGAPVAPRSRSTLPWRGWSTPGSWSPTSPGGWTASCGTRHERPTAALVDRLHRLLVAGVSARPGDRSAVEALVRQEAPLLPGPERALVTERVLHRVTGLGPFEPLLADPLVTDVLVNGPGRSGSSEPAGSPPRSRPGRRTPSITSSSGSSARSACASTGTTPSADARLPDGSRVNAIVPPVAVDGPCLTIRRFGPDPSTSTTSPRPAWPSCSDGRSRPGPTSWCPAAPARARPRCSTPWPPASRPASGSITVEDAAELRLPGEHVVRLEARPAGPDGIGEVTIRDLVRNALRMRPDRIVVGEVRAPRPSTWSRP